MNHGCSPDRAGQGGGGEGSPGSRDRACPGGVVGTAHGPGGVVETVHTPGPGSSECARPGSSRPRDTCFLKLASAGTSPSV